MKTYQFKGLYTNQKWLMPAYVQVNEAGKITYLSEQKPTSNTIEKVEGFAVAGFPNAHSHAFQYAMAGICERHHINQDDFWSWRNMMYHLALNISPEQLEAIATALYSEMLRYGYTSVAEFHYLHHDKDGKPYQNLAEMGERLCKAAQNVGIKITLLPVFYQKGGFGKEAQTAQRRFLSKNYADYQKLLDASQKVVKGYKNANIGITIHSLRAVDLETVKKVFEENEDKVIHIHIAEQIPEVESALKFIQRRPVEWLLDNVNLNKKHHLVHATHLLGEEIEGLVKSKANVVLCPSTEGNLGDGLFPLLPYQEKGGKWSIGTDSHVGLNPLEELRLLDYGQRLITHKRNIFVDKNEQDSGTFALSQVISTGRKAMGDYTNQDMFEIGQDFDALVISANSLLLANTSPENLLSTIVYSADVTMFLGTIVQGAWKIKNQTHPKGEELFNNFQKAIIALKNR